MKMNKLNQILYRIAANTKYSKIIILSFTLETIRVNSFLVRPLEVDEALEVEDFVPIKVLHKVSFLADFIGEEFPPFM